MMKSVQKLQINKEYLDKVPRPEPEQYDALKESIQEKGQLEPITVNEDYEIIDGYTRFQICNELKIEPEFKIRKFKDKHDESLFVRTVNQKRRQLNPLQIYQMFEDEIEEIRLQNIQTRNQCNAEKKSKLLSRNTPRMKYENSTQYKTMKLTGLSAGQVEGIVYLKRNADEKTIQNVISGKVGLFTIVNKMKENENKVKISKDLYRTKLKITMDILQSINNTNECKISMISRKANLSHYAVVAHLDPLINIKFVNEVKAKTYKYYILSDIGISFMNRCLALLSELPEELRI